MQRSKDEARARTIKRMLDELAQGTVVVEGIHDVKTLAHFGIDSIPFSRVSGNTLGCPCRKVYLFMDNDRGGAEKMEKIKSKIVEMGAGYSVNEVLGKRMLKLLNATSVEQMKGPITEALEKMEKSG